MDTLLDNAPCGFISFTDQGTVQAVNTTLLTMLGYQQRDVVGQHIERLMPVGTRIFYQTHWFPLLRLHGHAEEVFLMLRSKAGEDLALLSYARRRDDADVYDCVLVPVRERAKYEQELLRARKAAEESNRLLESQAVELERQAVELELQQEQLREHAERLEQLRAAADDANHAKSAFLATMSHELRTPLNAIGGYLQILEMQIPGPLTDSQRDILARVGKSSDHLLGLINEVLNLSRIESGQIDYELRAAPAAEVVAEVVPIMEQLVASKGLQLEIDVTPALKVHADIDKLHQILLNLLGNAVKFTEAGTIRLKAYPDNGQACFDVSDTGIGIPRDKLEAVFQPFVQVDASHTRTSQGSGLGLAISRDFARGMGGDITVRSTLGQGSTFTLIVPAAQ